MTEHRKQFIPGTLYRAARDINVWSGPSVSSFGYVMRIRESDSLLLLEAAAATQSQFISSAEMGMRALLKWLLVLHTKSNTVGWIVVDADSEKQCFSEALLVLAEPVQ